MERAEVSTRGLNRGRDKDDFNEDLDLQTVPQVEILDTTGKFMLGEGGSDDDEIDRGSNEAGDELLKVPDPTSTDRPGSEDS